MPFDRVSPKQNKMKTKQNKTKQNKNPKLYNLNQVSPERHYNLGPE